MNPLLAAQVSKSTKPHIFWPISPRARKYEISDAVVRYQMPSTPAPTPAKSSTPSPAVAAPCPRPTPRFRPFSLPVLRGGTAAIYSSAPLDRALARQLAGDPKRWHEVLAARAARILQQDNPRMEVFNGWVFMRAILAAKAGDVPTVQQFIDDDLLVHAAFLNSARTLAHEFVVSDIAPSLYPLLVAGGIDLARRGSDGMTALQLAVLIGKPGAVSGLLSNGADANSADHLDISPLHTLGSCRNLDDATATAIVAEFVRHGLNYRRATSDYTSPYEMACFPTRNGPAMRALAPLEYPLRKR